MSERNSSALFLSVAEVVLLSLDPTEGLMSVFIVSTIAFLKSLLNASFSRETEKEAVSRSILNFFGTLAIHFHFHKFCSQ